MSRKKYIISEELGYYSNKADSLAIVQYLRPSQDTNTIDYT